METSSFLLVKVLCIKEINMHAVQNAFDMVTNIAFRVKVSKINRAQNILN